MPTKRLGSRPQMPKMGAAGDKHTLGQIDEVAEPDYYVPANLSTLSLGTASLMLTQDSASSPPANRKAKHRSKFLKMLPGTRADSDPEEPFSKDYFPREDPQKKPLQTTQKMAPKSPMKTRNIDTIVNTTFIHLQKNFHLPLGAEWNPNIARVFEAYANQQEEIAELNKQKDKLKDMTTKAYDTIKSLKVEAENQQEKYMAEIKRMEVQVASNVGLEQVTLMRTGSILNPEERTKPSARIRKQQKKEPMIKEDDNASVRSLAWNRNEDPSTIESSLSKTFENVPAMVNAPPSHDFHVGTPLPTSYLVERLQTDEASAVLTRSNSTKGLPAIVLEKLHSNACFLPHEIGDLVKMMKMDRSDDAKTVRQAAELLRKHKQVPDDTAFEMIVEFLFAAHAPIGHASAATNDETSKSTRTITRGMTNHNLRTRPKSHSDPKPLSSSDSDDESNPENPAAVLESSYHSEPERPSSRPLSFVEGDDTLDL